MAVGKILRDRVASRVSSDPMADSPRPAVPGGVRSNDPPQDSRGQGTVSIGADLAAGVGIPFGIPGDYFHVVTAPVNDLQVRFDDGPLESVYQGLGFRKYYSRFELYSATGQTVLVRGGFGSVTDGRSTATVNVTANVSPGNTLKNGGDVACGATATTQLLAADTDRLYAIIKNPSTNSVTVRIGTNTVGAANGIPLEPGETLPLATTAAVYAYNPDAGAVTISAASVAQV